MQQSQDPARGAVGPNRRLAKLALFGVGGLTVLIFAVLDGVEVARQNRLDARYAPQEMVVLDEPRPARPDRSVSDAGDRSPLRVAVAPVISPEKSVRLYRALVDFLAEKLARDPVFMGGSDYGKVNEFLRGGQCDLGFVCTYAFVRGEREFGLQALVVPEIRGETTYHSLILTTRSSPATSLLDLRDKRFASADILSNSGWLYPAIWLMQRGHDGRIFFGKHILSGSHDRSVTAVCMGYVDGAAVDSLVYEQMVRDDPTIMEKTRVILKSPPFGMPPLVVPASIDPELKSALLAVLLDMSTDEKGRRILTSLGIDRFVVPPDGLFDSVRKNVAIWEGHE